MIDYIKEADVSLDKKKISNEITSLKAKYFEKDPLQGPKLDLDFVFSKVASIIPSRFLDYIDTMVLGQFDFLEKRDLDALYLEGSIYLSNSERDSEHDLIDDIIHEVAHAVDNNNESLIYGDGLVEAEFLERRRQLYFFLKENGFDEEVEFYDFQKSEFDDQFDTFLYQEVGYAVLANYTSGLVCSPYGITSLKEYFANAFEHYFFVQSPTFVKQVSPSVYSKIQELLESD